MSIIGTKIEKDIRDACQARDGEAFQRAFSTLQLKQSALPFGTVPMCLYLFCCEEAIKLEAWDIAEFCLSRLHAEEQPMQLLECRTLFCESKLRCNRNNDKGLRNLDWIQHRHACAALVVQGIKLALRQSPWEARLILEGADLLWSTVEPIYYSGNFSSVIDVVVFLKSLYDRLGLGGAYTRLQWCIRHATCLRGMGLPQDALPIVSEAFEIVSRLRQDRLQLQMQRFLSLTLAEKELCASKNAKGDVSSVANIISKGLYQHAVHLMQMLISGHIELNASIYVELSNLYERIAAIRKSKSPDALAETITNTSSILRMAGHSKGNKPIKNQQQQIQITENDITDKQVQEEVLSNLVFCLCMCGAHGYGEEWDSRVGKTLQQLSRSTCTRVRVFATLTEVVGLSHHTWQLVKSTSVAPDAPLLKRSSQHELLKSIRKVEKMLMVTHGIPDSADRLYVLRVVCFVLWKLCLPLLQTDARIHVASTLDRIIKALEGYQNSFLPPYIVYLLYESSLTELDYGSISVAKLRAEKALLWFQRHFNNRNNARLGGGVTCSMEFPIMWLCHCIKVGDYTSMDNVAASLGGEDQVLLLIMQAKRAKKGPKRMQFLRNAYTKLIALESISPWDAGDAESVRTSSFSGPIASQVPHGNVHTNTKNRHFRVNSKISSALTTECLPRRSLVELYAMFLQECRREMAPSLIPMMKATAGAMCGMQIFPDGHHPELVYLQAQAHLIYAEIIALESDRSATSTVSRAGEGAELLVRATVLDAACIAKGVSTGWVTVCSCELFLQQYNVDLLLNGGDRDMHHYLDELYCNFSRLNVLSVSTDSSLIVNLALAYVLSLTREYIEIKGEINNELSAPTLEEYVSSLFCYPKTDANHSLLKKALEVCQEVIQRVKEVSCKVHLCMLLPCLNRLLGITPKLDSTAPPQVQLLYLLGRVSGPISREEKLSLLKKDIMDLLAVDPSVQLCGRVAMIALDLNQDRIVSEVFRWGNALYAKGRLAWGMLAFRTNPPLLSTTGNLNNSTVSSALSPQIDVSEFSGQPFDVDALNASSSVVPMQPNSEDWMWYARLLYCQAFIFHKRILQANTPVARRLHESILCFCTNCSIAASHAVEAPHASRAFLIERSLFLYYGALCSLGLQATRPPIANLASSLKIMLSKSILTYVLESKEPKTPSSDDETGFARKPISRLLHMLCQMSECLFRCYANAGGRFAEVVSALAYLRSKLPLPLQKQLGLLEIIYTSRTSHGSDRKVSETLGCDFATKSLAWMALARSIHHEEVSATASLRVRCRDAWENALRYAEKCKLLKAQCFLEMAQSCLSLGVITVDQAKEMLFSGLSLIEEKADAGKNRRSTLVAAQDAMTAQDFNISLIDICSIDPFLTSNANETIHSNKGYLQYMSSSSRSVRSRKDEIYLSSVFKARFLGIHILYALFTLAPHSFPDEGGVFTTFTDSSDGFHSGYLRKLNVAGHLLKHVRLLWINLVNTLASEGEKSSWVVPITFSEWFHFRCDEGFCEAARACSDLDFSLNTETFQGILFDVADFFVESDVPYYSFILYQSVRLLAAIRYGTKSFHTEAVWRASSGKLVVAALRCGFEMREFAEPVAAPPTAQHWQQILKCIRKSSENEGDLSTFDGDAPNQFLEMKNPFVRWITTKGSLQDVLLNEADVLSSLGRIKESAVIADLIFPHAKLSKDLVVMCRCWLLKCTLLEVSGCWRNAIELLEQHEEEAWDASPSIWVRWQGEKFRQLLCMAHDVSRTKTVFFSLIQKTNAFSQLPGIGEELACHLKKSLHRKLLGNLLGITAHRALDEAQKKSFTDLLEVIVGDLCLSRDLRDRVAVLVVDTLRRRELNAIQSYQNMPESDILELFQHLVREASTAELLLKDVQAELKELNANQLSIKDQECLCPPHCVMENQLLTLLFENYADRIQLAEEILFRYQHLTLDELALPRGEGTAEMEKAVIEYYRNPSGARAERHRLTEEWESSLEAWPLEVVHAFQHFGIPSVEQMGSFVTRYQSRAVLCAAREALHEGHCIHDHKTCFLILQWEWRHTLEMIGVAESNKHYPSTDEVPCREWSSMLQNVVKQMWSVTSMTSILEKHMQSRHSDSRNRREAKVDSIVRPIMTDEMLFVMKIASRIVKDAQHRLDFEVMSDTFCFVALFLSVWGFYRRAAYAAELALAAKNAHCVLQFYNTIQLESNTSESRLWNTFQRLLHTNDSFAVHSHEFTRIREELLTNSSVLNQCVLTECALNSTLEDESLLPVTPPNTMLDGVCLTILLANEGHGVSYGIPSSLSMFFVVLRHPDGSVDSRLKYADPRVFTELATELRDIKESMRRTMASNEAKGSTSATKVVSFANNALLDLLARIEEAILPLMEEFDPSLSTLCTKNPLYLCLDPILQPLPVEHTSFFSKFPSVSRELNAWAVIRRVGQKPVKSSSSPALQVIDPFADHPASVSLFTSAEHYQAKSKVDVLSSVQEKYPLQRSYLKYKLQTVAYNALLFNGCGSFTSVFTPAVLATAQLKQMQTLLIVFDGVTNTSQRRGQRYCQSLEAVSPLKRSPEEAEMWQVLLFLLACGVRFIATTWYPSLPDEHDVLCKRLAAGLIPGRGNIGDSPGGSKAHKDPKREFRILHYGGRVTLTRGR